jgi:predicted nucleic acid-binding protein
MPNYFADTSFWIAIVDQRDRYHAKAIQWSTQIDGVVTTTQAVLLETANTFSRPMWRGQAIALIDNILSRPNVEIVPLSDAA